MNHTQFSLATPLCLLMIANYYKNFQYHAGYFLPLSDKFIALSVKIRTRAFMSSDDPKESFSVNIIHTLYLMFIH